MLAVRDLHVRYGAVHAVNGVSFDVAAGELLAVLGPNGAGKSSTLAAVAGIVARGGAVDVDGRPVVRAADARRAGVVSWVQGRGLFRRMTVEQNLVLGAYGERRSQRASAVDAALRRVPELAAWRSRRVASLSGGEQALVALGRVLVGRPRVLLLDEPGLGLDPHALERLMGEVAALRDDGVAVVLVEQYAERALAVAHRMIVLERGRVAQASDAPDPGAARELVDAYLRPGR